MKKATKTEMNALYTAFDIHRRAIVLAAKWIAFDPFGAIVYALRDLESSAFAVREAVNNAKDFWDFSKEPNHPLRQVKAGRDEYATFANHIKGIEGAVRRLLANKWAAELFNSGTPLLLLDELRDSLKELKANL